MAFNDGIKVGPIAYIGLVSVLVTFVLVMLLQVLYYRQDKRARETYLADAPPPEMLTELTAQQQTKLRQRGYVDRERDIVAVGIERAKELVVTELAAGKRPSDVIGPKQPVAPPAKETPPAKESAESGEDQPAADAATTDTTAEANDPPPEKQEPKDDPS